MTSLLGTRVRYHAGTGNVCAVALGNGAAWFLLIAPDTGGPFESVLASMCTPIAPPGADQ